jgi:hypothetical protein
MVLIACLDLELPILTAIVVNQINGSPTPPSPTGEDADATNNTWDMQAQRVFDHVGWPDVNEIDWEYIWRNPRHNISNRHGIRGYWGR